MWAPVGRSTHRCGAKKPAGGLRQAARSSTWTGSAYPVAKCVDTPKDRLVPEHEIDRFALCELRFDIDKAEKGR